MWVDGKSVGVHRSYLTPFRIDLSQPSISVQAGQTITIAARVDARRNRAVDPLMGCLDTLDFLYVNWGGLHQPVRLEAAAPTRIDDLFVLPHLANNTAEIRVAIAGPKSRNLHVAAQVLDADGDLVKSADELIKPDAPETVLAVLIANPKLWSPNSPHLYTARINLLSEGATLDQRTVRFGMREFKVAGGKFLVERQANLPARMIHGDDCIFPNTICPPADKGELRARLALAREYGFNFVRCIIPAGRRRKAISMPPTRLGMMLQPGVSSSHTPGISPPRRKLAAQHSSNGRPSSGSIAITHRS